MDIGGVEIPTRLALAPMAGVSDLAFRTVCREQGAGLTCTEMVSAMALVYQDKKTTALLRLGQAEHPAAAQIFGSDPDVMAKAARLALEASGADIIDINMGCPTPKIASNGSGSALMKNPVLAGKIIEAVVEAVPVPVTVKLRKGWDKGSVNVIELAKIAQDCGAAAICVHGRTRSQMYSGVADWDIIAEVKRSVGIPVIANGDVFDEAAALKILRYTGADMAMIGRGALGDPWIFARSLAAIEGHDIPALPPLSERCDIAVKQFELAAMDKGEHIACLEARKHYTWYLRGVPYAGYYKEQIQRISTLEAIYSVTKGIKRDLR